jgi:protein-L-isoaspartate O-methyltransferase
MLNRLDVRDGQRVLEIGTGTGWNAALLAYRLGTTNVVSVEIDPEVARAATARLEAIGRPVTVVSGDGAQGVASAAPFDRVIATCSVERVPGAWVEQTTPGGLVLLPWGPPMANSHLLRLDVDDQGNAVGTIVGAANFMRLRAQAYRVTDEPDDFDTIAMRSTTDLNPREVLGNHARLAVALRLGECRASFEDSPHGEVLWLLAADSWASVEAGVVRQAGARLLWDEAVAAYEWWRGEGSPERPRFHLTVSPRDGQWVWLDAPDNVVLVLAGKTSR